MAKQASPEVSPVSESLSAFIAEITAEVESGAISSMHDLRLFVLSNFKRFNK